MTERIVALTETAVPDHTALTSKTEAAQTTAELEELIAACATKEELAVTEALIPAVDQFVTQNDIDTSIAELLQNIYQEQVERLLVVFNYRKTTIH